MQLDSITARTTKIGACVLLTAGGHLPATAQILVPLVEEGDSIPGVGIVTSITSVTVNDAGAWIVRADTDHADQSQDEVFIKNGVLFLREGQALPAPSGATLDGIDNLTLDAGGQSGWSFDLDGTTGSSDDSGVYLDTSLLIQEGGLSNAAGFSAGTVYKDFFATRARSASSILLSATVDDPALASTTDRALVLLALDGAGNLVSETVVVKESDLLAGQTNLVEDLETGAQNFALNGLGSVLFIADLAGSTAVDHVVYLDSLLLAQEGSPSPVLGRNWESLALAEVDLNDAGDSVISADLNGTTADDLLIVKNGLKFRQENDTFPAIAPERIVSFGTGPVLLAENGNVLWYAAFTGDASTDTGLFLEDTLLVQEGVTTINGVAINVLPGLEGAYAMSPNGRYIVFEATLDDGTNGAYRLSLGPGIAISRNGTGVNPVCLTSGSTPILGQDWIAVMDATGHAGASSTWILAFAQPLTGLPTPFGELLVLPEALGGTLLAFSFVAGGGANTHTIPLPNELDFLGQVAYLQGLILGGGPELCNALDVYPGY